jgi:predicted nucleic acid-binding protein
VTLCDAGPLVALIDRDDPDHARCRAALQDMELLVSTWQCFTEAMHLAYRAGGYKAQEALWTYWEEGLLALHASDEGESARMRELMHQYRDAPMDLADASLVTAAEWLQLRQVFTLDRHFHAYRIHGRHAFEVVPAQTY